MATNKNFEVKNGLTIAGTERISSAGAFTGSLASATTATTQSATDNSTKIATTAYTDAAITAVIGGAPGTLDTLNELAAAINDDASYASTLTTALATKLPLAGGTMTGNLTIDSAGSAAVTLDRASTSTGSTIDFKTAGTLKWYMGLRGLTNDNFYLRNEVGSSDALTILTDGNVGIGDTSPIGKLTVKAAGDTIRAESLATDAKNITMSYHDGNDQGQILCGQDGVVDKNFVLRGHTLILQRNGGTEAMRIDSSGNVAIGHTTTTGSKLAICDGANSQIQFFPEISTDTNLTQHYDPTASAYINAETRAASHAWKIGTSEYMRVHTDGKVGIGTFSPTTPLHTATGSNGSGLVDVARFQNTGTTVNDGARIQLTAGTSTSGAGIGCLGDALNSAHLVLHSGGNNERMRIKSNGHVGIGTTSPNAKLYISGKDDTIGASDLLALQFDNSPADTGITFRDIFDGVQSRFTLDSGNTNDLRISSGTKMHFYGGTSNGTGNGHLLIHSTGHVGIVAGKRFYLDNASIASGDTYIDEYSANEVGITTGGSRKFALSGGNLYHTGSLNSNHNFSDERLKENIVVIPNALEKVSSLRGITFTRKDDGSVGTGLIAQELEKVLPEAVYESKTIDSLENPDAEEWKAINYGNTVGLLVEAIKELEARIATLEG